MSEREPGTEYNLTSVCLCIFYAADKENLFNNQELWKLVFISLTLDLGLILGPKSLTETV